MFLFLFSIILSFYLLYSCFLFLSLPPLNE